MLIFGEVKERGELFTLIVAPDAEHAVVPGQQEPRVGPGHEDPVGRAELLKEGDGGEKLALHGLGIAAVFGGCPVHLAAVEVAAVGGFVGIVVVGVVVLLADLVAAVQNGDAAEGEHVGVQHDVETGGPLDRALIVFIAPGFQAAEGGGSATQPRIAQAGIVIVELASCGAAPPLAGEIVVEETLVLALLRTEAGEEAVVEAPADIVMAAEVV